ncbi:MAG: phenylalanine--tRNA ligase subunit beta [Clostridia bacterium]|nr:phenylalanine--tRNA ligase subunit beta [Clostridia bacterium]
MIISCNLLKEFITSKQPIDWLNIWNKFTMTTAEVEDVVVKGKNISDVIVSKVENIEQHPQNSQYAVLTLNIGSKNINVITSAKNAYIGMITACCVVGGKINDKSVEEVEFLGIKSEGVCLSEKELDISQDHTGIIDLPKNYSIGSDIKEYVNLEDIIVEIDNKSLTNRPDLWGHYGIAREVAALAGVELKEIPIMEVNKEMYEKKGKFSVDVCVDSVNRYTAIKVSGVHQEITDINMKLILHYCGYESNTLTELITNYVTLELGLPIVTLKGNNVSNISIKMFEGGECNDLNITKDNLLVYGNGKVMEVAGVRTLDDYTVTSECDCIIIEVANYDASVVRKSSISLHDRTESSIRHEKSLDPEMTLLALARCLYLLKKKNITLNLDSNIMDFYPKKQEKNKIRLTCKKLKNYLGFEMDSETVLNILRSLDMEVKFEESCYLVTVPTYRSTKDMRNDADVIEEITRVYGYDNLKPQPLKLNLEIKHNEISEYLKEYELKKVLAEKYNLHEVNTYIWYDDDFLKNAGIDKSYCEEIINKPTNKYIRDELGLSVLAATIQNAKKFSKYGVFEIGTVNIGKKLERQLSIILCDSIKNAPNCYMEMKNIVQGTIRLSTNCDIRFMEDKPNNLYMDNNTVISIYVKDTCIGQIGIASLSITKKYHKTSMMVIANIYFDQLNTIEKVCHDYRKPSKYPSVSLDYTISLSHNERYQKLEDALSNYQSVLLKSYEIIDVYEKAEERKVTIRVSISRDDRTLKTEEIRDFSNNLVSYLKKHFKVEA